MTVNELIRKLETLENGEEANVKLCVHGGPTGSVEEITWEEKESTYVIWGVNETV